MIIMPVNLGSVDLKLLVVFDAVMTERSVTQAARRLGMSQPAVSNALSRVRHLLKDQLFTRSSDGMQPTPRALEIAGPVHDVMRKLEATLEPTHFDARTTDWTFKLGVSDHASVVMLPALVHHLARAAPRIRLSIRPKDNDTVAKMLTAGELDLAIGVVPPLPRSFGRLHLFDDTYVCVMAADHPHATGGFTLEDYAAASHLALRPSQTRTSGIDQLAQQVGITRQVALVINQFVAAPALIRGSAMIASLFERMTDHLDQSGLVLRPLPFPKPLVPIAAVWNRSLTSHPAHRWLRLQVLEVGKRVRQTV